ncbi:Tle cognate immunity protein 4 C-terminal domain-containing protein [Paraburkholderia sacchari]|uniref:T6SS immunity protein Tli4 family protein n=1 Tax=Paraburkholderia sacchari TaxID=159450 RepID=UPI0039A68151
MNRLRATLVFTCLIFTVAACDYKLAPLSQKEKQVVTELTANLKARCAGRYLIDMPEDASEYGYAKIQGVDVTAEAMTEEAYRQEIAQREATLKATKSIDAYPFLYVAGAARGENSYYFVHRGTVHDDPSRRNIEGYKWNQGYRFLLKFEAYDYMHPDQTDDPIVRKMDIKNNFPDKVDLVLGLLERLRGRPKEEIPTEPGLCFAGGFLPGKATDEQYVRGGYSLANHPDVFFTVSVDTASQGNMTLLQHADNPVTLDALKAMDANVIRKGAVELSGMRAEEWLFESLRPGDGRGDTFALSVNDSTSGPSSPYLSLGMKTGGQLEIQGKYVKFDRGTLSTGEAVALWDVVSRTVRIRSGAL